jgi:3'-phosphoadenosine 5'-phosphosulfate sulfotransferase (PAPS reductase)/FAD synthetase
MDAIEKEGFLAYSTLPNFKRKVEKAKAIIKEAIAVSQKRSVSLSGGKDSIATLILVEQVSKELNQDYAIWSHISDASFPGTKEIILECAEKTGKQLILDESPVSAFSVKREKTLPQFGKTGFFFDAIARHYQSGFDLSFIGVRSKESSRRKKAIKVHGVLFQSTVPEPHWNCYPIAYFTTIEVFALALANNYPIHPIYDKDPLNTRLGYITSADLMHLGTIAELKQNYPEEYNKLIEAFPERGIYS